MKKPVEVDQIDINAENEWRQQLGLSIISAVIDGNFRAILPPATGHSLAHDLSIWVHRGQSTPSHAEVILFCRKIRSILAKNPAHPNGDTETDLLSHFLHTLDREEEMAWYCQDDQPLR